MRFGSFTRVAQFALVAATAFASPAADAGTVVDRIKAEGVIRSGGASRPGLLGQSLDGREALGLFLDLCRAIGAALLGPKGRIEFHPYDADIAFDRLREGRDDLAFLDGSEILEQRVAGQTVLGPAVAFESTAVMVPETRLRKPSPTSRTGRSAFTKARARTGAWRDLDQQSRGLDFTRMAYTEYGEMGDAYAARKCDAVVGEIGDLRDRAP